MKVLLATSGPLEGSAFPIHARTLIGRDGDCDIQVIDLGVSRKHACVIEQADGSVLVRDLRSNNGTLVGGQRAVEALLLPGDEISIGESRFSYCDSWDDPPRKSELDIRLISGPAVVPTMNLSLTDDDRVEIMARVQSARLARQQRAKTQLPKAITCCDSPLSTQAREQGWTFCPACGGRVSA
jgi:pSer/pThr/pTyr-binding forkhead associated (FHA) protein